MEARRQAAIQKKTEDEKKRRVEAEKKRKMEEEKRKKEKSDTTLNRSLRIAKPQVCKFCHMYYCSVLMGLL
jgi:hypothetical protein